MVSREEAKKLLDSLYGELGELQERMREAARQQRAVEKLIDGYEELYPDLSRTEDDEDEEQAPRGQGAVERLLEGRPGIWVTTRDVVLGLQRRNWLPESRDPVAAVRAALERAWTDPESLIYKSGPTAQRPVMWAYDPASNHPEEEGYEPDEDDSERMEAAAREGAA
jgi:hypothetical protein